MFAKIFLLCAAAAAANANVLYGSGLFAPGYYSSGILAPGLLNTAVAPGYYKGSPFLSAPIAAAVPTTYAAKTVIAAPAAITTKSVVAAPLAYAARPVVAAPAAITTHKTVIGATSLLTGAPLVYSNSFHANGLIGAYPYGGLVSPIGLKGAGLLAGPGVVKTILK